MKVLAVLALALAAGAARADPTSGELTYGAQRGPHTSIGVSLGIGGGVTNFVNSDMKDLADIGGTYEVRGTVGTRLMLAAEAAYVGSVRDLKGASGVSGDSQRLFGNGFEGAARVQLPYVTGAWMLEPFAFGGLGWNHVSVNGTVTTASALRGSSDILVVPFGGGISATWNGFMLEGRFTYRQTFNEELLKAGDQNLSSWSAGGLLGYEF